MGKIKDPKAAQAVKELQQRFKEEYESNPDIYIKDDFNRIMADDYYVYRFYRARHNDWNATFEMMKETMKYRKCTVRLDEYKDYTFPIEFYKDSAVFPYEPDKNGYPTVYIRVSQHRKVPELEEYTKAFFIHTLDKADRLYGSIGLAVVFDLSRASYRNLDWDYLKFMINFGAYYCPAGVKYILVLNVPWALNAFRKMVFSFLNDDYFKLIKFAEGDEIYQFIDRKNVPYYLGGECKRNYCAYPKGSKPIRNLVEQYGYTQADYDRIIPVYQDALDEADELITRVADLYDPEGFFDEPEEFQADRMTVKPELDENANPIDSERIFRVEPCQTIEFKLNPQTGRYSGHIRIFNESKSSIAYKVQSNSPKNFSVHCHQGIIVEASSITVNIDLVESSQQKLDSSKFRIVVIPGVMNQMTVNQFNNLWSDSKRISYSNILKIELESMDRGDGKPVKALKRMVNSIKSSKPLFTFNKKNDDRLDEKISLQDQVRNLIESSMALEIQQKRLSLILYVLGFFYLFMLFHLFLGNNQHIKMRVE